ncbi:MAG: toxic anion resistance protein [Oscillospiraceae bacterium]|nr:toxic anion resistance protein [Oscillospiraceae bacterium]
MENIKLSFEGNDENIEIPDFAAEAAKSAVEAFTTSAVSETEEAAAETFATPATPAAETFTTPAVPAVAFTPIDTGVEIIPDTSAFTPAELKQIADFAKQIDVTNSTQMLAYGGGAQKKIQGFSEAALQNVKTKEVDEIGEMITGLVVQLKNFDAEDKGKKPGLFKKQRDKMALTKARYDTVEKNVDKICGTLENHKIVLMKDVAMLDQMYNKNLEYYKELSMYIIAGRQRLAEIVAVELPEIQRKATESGLAEDAQEANNLAEMCNRFDKKLHDLELSKTVSMQMSPQIRMVQGTNNMMVEKINSSLVNVIPLWKNQMVLALGMAHTQSAIRAQKEVSDITNQLLRKNADALKQNTIEAAKESERGIVDIETLRHTNQSLITTLDEVLQIQQTGREKRREAQVELHKIEEELKAKLLDIRDAGKPAVVETTVAGGSGLTLEG